MGHKKANPGQQGIWKSKKNPDDPDVKVVDTSYTSEDLARMVAHAWKNTAFRDSLVGSTVPVNTRAANAKTDLENNRGILLDKVIVITEDEYDAGWQQDDEDEVVLVLPNRDRVKTSASETDLLETAKLLMACVPNGI
jgi:hypothetical protein